MKKKTRFKLKNSLAGAFWTSIAFCITGACYFGTLFYFSFFSTLSRLNDTPIAAITFKYKTAQRKFIDRVVWDRLRQNSPLYNGDTIHTAPGAEATITFTDGNVMDLMENTMAQVFMSDADGLSTNISDGSVFVDGGASERGITLNSNGMTVNTQAGAAVSFATISGGENGQSGEGGTGTVQLNVLNGSAAYSGSDGSVQTVSGGEGVNFEYSGQSFEAVTRPSLIVTQPVPNAKLVYHTEGTTDVDFVWKSQNFDESAQFILEISSDRNFANILASKYVSEFDRSVMPLKAGTYYWRLRTQVDSDIKSGKNAEGAGPALPSQQAANNYLANLAMAQYVQTTGKVQIIQSLPPSLVAPVKNYSYSYRRQLPAVRLIWTECEGASSYRLEVSKDQSFSRPEISQRTSSTSSIISTLKEGKYYWRVTPFYSLNREGFALPSEVNTFAIEQKGNLVSPKLMLPAADSIVNTDENAKDITFSWRQDDEAAKYTLLVADNPQLRNPKIKRELTENFALLKGKEKGLQDGKWYWSVYLTDIEGNSSEPGKPGEFYAVKGELEQHTIEPLNGYGVAQNLLLDLKFTWKQNLPGNFKTRFQISKDREFTNIAYQTSVNSDSIKGLNLSDGTYWWRIVSEGTVGTEENQTDQTAQTGSENASAQASSLKKISFVTPAKQLEVLPSLDAPVIITPAARAVAREEYPVEFAWDPVPDADFYKFNIYKEKDGSLVYSDNIYDITARLNMYGSKFEDKTDYRIEIQAMANGVVGITSRRSGLLGIHKFNLVKLRPVEVTSPSRGARIDGLDAVLMPGKIVWNSVDEVKEAQIVLTKVDGREPVVILKNPTDEEFAAGKKIAPKSSMLDTPDGLESGSYELIVYAKTLDDIDISNTSEKNITRFTILPVEPLAAVKNVQVTPEKLDASYLAQSHKASITITWQPVAAATEYRVSITDTKDHVLYSKNVTAKNSYELDLLNLEENERRKMQNGTFKYSVEALRRMDTNGDGVPDKIIQRGIPAGGKFTTSIEEASAAQGRNVLNNFGRKK